MHPGHRPVIVGELDAGALARPARRGVAGIAVEEQLRGLIENEQAHRAVEAGNGSGADADLGAARAHQQWHRALRLRRIAWRFGRRHAARVVAVIAHAGAEEEFGFVERPEDDAQFGTADRDFVVARVRLLQDRIHRRRIIIAAPAGGGLEPIGPVHRVLDIDAGIALADVVDKDVRQELALHRIGQRQRDIVIARLHAEHGFSRPAEQRALDGARDTAAAISAIVVLMELVAVDRIGQEPGEVVVEVEPVFHHIAIGLPLPAVVGLRQAAPTARSGWYCRRRSGSSSPSRPIRPDAMARSGIWSVEFQVFE